MITQKDKKVKRKIQKLTYFKEQSPVCAAAYSLSNDAGMQKKVDKLLSCGDWVHGDIVQDNRGDKHLKITHANFCKVRLCPMCQWRRGAKCQTQMIQTLDHINRKSDFGIRYVFITLTVPNPDGDHLKEKIDQMQEGWKTLTNSYRKMRRSMLGYYRSLEITYNPEADTYHPHFHAIVAVDIDYFNNPDKYIERDELLQAWRDAMDDQTISQVDIRAFKGTNLKQMLKSLQETCKYICKPSGLLNPDDMDTTARVVETVHLAIERRRLLSFGGIIAKARRELGLTSVERQDADLTDETTGTAKRLGGVSLLWCGGFYQITVND